MIARVLEEALARRDLPYFYKAFRATELPFLCARPARLFEASFDVLHQLGAISPAVALAVENHYYVTSAIATFPAESDPELHRRREELLATIVRDRLLVANTNSKVHGGKLGELGTIARRSGSSFVIDGEAAYTSLATEADLLIAMAELEGEGLALFTVAPLQNHPGVEIGDYLFPRAMIDSDTRRIKFTAVEASLLASARHPLSASLFAFEMAWHQLLIPAIYLGAAAGALEAARTFLISTKGRDGRPLAELDGMITDVGRLAIDYQAARLAVLHAGESLAEIRRLPEDAALVDRAVLLAGAAKYSATRAAEAIVTTCVRIVGARAFAGDSILERLSQEVVFASLGPEVSAVIERRFGKQVLERGVVER